MERIECFSLEKRGRISILRESLRRGPFCCGIRINFHFMHMYRGLIGLNWKDTRLLMKSDRWHSVSQSTAVLITSRILNRILFHNKKELVRFSLYVFFKFSCFSFLLLLWLCEAFLHGKFGNNRIVTILRLPIIIWTFCKGNVLHNSTFYQLSRV